MTEYKKGTPWLVLTPEMKQFEKKTGKSAVFRGKITGQFEYYLWQKEKKAKTKPIKKPQLTRGLKEIKKDKLKRIEKEYNRLSKLRKDELVRIAQQASRLDISHIKREDKYTIRNTILESQFGRKSMEEFDNYLFKTKSIPTPSQLTKSIKKTEKLQIEARKLLKSKYYLEFHGKTASGGKSSKFYEIQRVDNIIHIRYGKIGYPGVPRKGTYKTPELAEKQMIKTVNSKLAKGYKETKKKLESPKKRVTTPKSKRIYPMLAGSGDHLLGNPNYILQQKYDGTRCVIIKKNNTIKLISRSWKSDYTANFPEIVKDIKKIPLKSFIFDGELTFFKENKDIFLTVLATDETKKGYIAKGMIFDVLEYNNKDVRNMSFRNRDKLLHKLIPKNLRHLEVVKSYKTNHKKLFENIVSDKNQGEGVILKRLDSIYSEGARTRDWVKLKRWRTDEAIVVGVVYGTGARSSTFGSLILAQYYKNKLVLAGKSSGFKMAEQEQLIKMMKPHITKIPQVAGISDTNVKYWVKPKIVIEVKFQELTKHGKFRFPSFMRFRHDKEPKECIKR